MPATRALLTCAILVIGISALRLQKQIGKAPPSVNWVVHSGAEENDGKNFQDRVIPAAQTWLRGASEGTVFVVFGDTDSSRQVLKQNNCKNISSPENPEYPEYSCKVKNGATLTAVLVPCSDRNHDHAIWADGICCKYEETAKYLSKRGGMSDFTYIGDDDVYIDRGFLVDALSKVDDPEKLYVVNPDGNLNQQKPELHHWNKEITACNYNLGEGFVYSVHSRGMMNKYVEAIPKDPMRAVCTKADTAQDIAIGLWSWHLGAKFLPANQWTDFNGDRPVGSLEKGQYDKLFLHGLHHPESFQNASRVVDRNTQTVPEKWEALDVVRDYMGKNLDDCAKYLALFNHAKEQALTD